MKTYLRPIVLLHIISTSMLHAKDLKSFANNKSLCFIENKGQITDQFGKSRNDIQFKISAGKGLNIFIGNGQLHYQWSKPINTAQNKFCHGEPGRTMTADLNPKDYIEDSTATYRMDVSLLNSNPNAEIITEEKQDYYENYFQAGLGEKGARAYTYKKITYKNIYPNIDWVLYISSPSVRSGEVNYDFIIHPGGNVKDIKLQYNGATNLSLNKDRSLTAKTLFGNITEQSPYTYEKEGNNKITSSFVLKDNILSFNVDNYNNKNTLLIDPPLAWATYFGGSYIDFGESVACDQYGNVYMGAYTASISNIATLGSYFSSYSAAYNTFLAKFNALGGLLWATYYYGGNNNQYLCSHRVACDVSGNIYICGDVSGTLSGSLATLGAHQTSIAGYSDAYLAKFDGSGSILWATFFGGPSYDYGNSVSCDPSGNVYLTGWTGSSSGIATSGAYQTSLFDTSDAYLAKFNSSGSLQWSTYFGASCPISAYYVSNVTCDGAGNVFMCGSTCSGSNIATSNAYQTSLGGAYDGFLAKFNSSGSIQWGTYYGGGNNDFACGLGCDDSGNIYMSGYTASTNGIASAGAYQISLAGGVDAFLVKFDSSGNKLWGTYYGGTGNESSLGLVCNSFGRIYVAGSTYSANGIATTSSYQTSLAGPLDAFLAEFDGSGNIVWATYYGGSNNEEGSGISCDHSDNIFTCGMTESTSSIATTGAYQTSLGGSWDAFLAKWGTDSLFRIGAVTNLYCAGDTLHLPVIAIDSFQSGNVFIAQLSDSSGSFTNNITIGIDTSVVSGSILCAIPLSTITGFNYHFRVISTSTLDTLVDTIAIQINAKPFFTISSNTLVCNGKSLIFTTTSNFPSAVYHWSGPNSFLSSVANPVINPVSFADSGYSTGSLGLENISLMNGSALLARVPIDQRGELSEPAAMLTRASDELALAKEAKRSSHILSTKAQAAVRDNFGLLNIPLTNIFFLTALIHLDILMKVSDVSRFISLYPVQYSATLEHAASAHDSLQSAALSKSSAGGNPFQTLALISIAFLAAAAYYFFAGKKRAPPE